MADEPERTLTYEPRRFQFNGASVALMLCALPIFVLVLELESPWRYVAASIAVIPTAWAVRRAFRIDLLVTEDRVTVKNYWRTHSFLWSEVEGVGVALKGVLPLPALAFKLRSGAVFAQAIPPRKSERQEFQAAVLALAPSTVVTMGDVALPIGTDRALSNRLRLWWLRNQPPRAPLRVRGPERVWLEQPFPFSLFSLVSGLVVSGLAVVFGISALVGALKDDAGALRYLLAALLLVSGGSGCVGLTRILKRGARK
jgi:hypothetical protein